MLKTIRGDLKTVDVPFGRETGLRDGNLCVMCGGRTRHRHWTATSCAGRRLGCLRKLAEKQPGRA
jgi:hypothetical protein